ncbi:MAG: hypothetical protein K6T16_01995 [Candidatus Pacearchaeota archaeon]|nr:hypothetical protein [Candidatus Pacearchaeota archaeon]
MLGNRYKFMLPRQGDIAIFERGSLAGLVFEPKFDGVRVLLYKDGNDIELINQKGKDIVYRYPELLYVISNINAKNCVLDAGLVVLGKGDRPDPLKLQQREQLDSKEIIDAGSRTMPSTLFVFDILEKEGVSLVEKPLAERKRILAEVITDCPLITRVFCTSQGRELWKKIQEQEIEGLIAKELSSKYEQGKRSWAWLKINHFNTINAIVFGFVKDQNRRAFSKLILGVYVPDKAEPIYLGAVSESFDAQTTRNLRKLLGQLKTNESFLPENERAKIAGKVTWLKPELIAKIRFLEMTREKGLKEPRLIRLRFDKNPEDCVLWH